MKGSALGYASKTGPGSRIWKIGPEPGIKEDQSGTGEWLFAAGIGRP